MNNMALSQSVQRVHGPEGQTQEIQWTSRNIQVRHLERVETRTTVDSMIMGLPGIASNHNSEHIPPPSSTATDCLGTN